MMIYQPGKLSATSRRCLDAGLAVVAVGFPACSLMTARMRLCISSAHTREDLEWALSVRPLPSLMLWQKHSFSCYINDTGCKISLLKNLL